MTSPLCPSRGREGTGTVYWPITLKGKDKSAGALIHRKYLKNVKGKCQLFLYNNRYPFTFSNNSTIVNIMCLTCPL